MNGRASNRTRHRVDNVTSSKVWLLISSRDIRLSKVWLFISSRDIRLSEVGLLVSSRDIGLSKVWLFIPSRNIGAIGVVGVVGVLQRVVRRVVGIVGVEGAWSPTSYTRPGTPLGGLSRPGVAPRIPRLVTPLLGFPTTSLVTHLLRVPRLVIQLLGSTNHLVDQGGQEQSLHPVLGSSGQQGENF